MFLKAEQDVSVKIQDLLGCFVAKLETILSFGRYEAFIDSSKSRFNITLTNPFLFYCKKVLSVGSVFKFNR